MQKKIQVWADPVIVNFFEITSVGSSAFQKILQRLDQPTLVIFFAFLKKITSHFLSPNGQGLGYLFQVESRCAKLECPNFEIQYQSLTYLRFVLDLTKLDNILLLD